jgi:hypothetical protein
MKCGHVFCKSCVNTHLEFSDKCPQCGKLIEKNRIQSIKFVIEIVDKQNIYCKNRNQGCEWIGKVPELEIHLNKCSRDKFQNGNCFAPKKIVSSYNSTDEIEKTKLINNGLLSSQDSQRVLENRYEEIDLCESKNGESCDDNEMIECVFSKFGCKAKFSKSNALGHSIENINVHNELLNEWVLGFQKKLVSRLDNLEDKIQQIKQNDVSKEESYTESNLENGIDKKDYLILGKKRMNDYIYGNEYTLFDNKEISNNDKTNTNINNNEITLSKSLFDEEIISQGLVVLNNTVKFTSKLKNSHAFAFINIPLNKGKITWKVKIINFSIWLGLGVCEKAKVIKNGLIFKKPKNIEHNHSCFLLSSNSYIWNCNNPVEDNKYLKCLPNLTKNDEVVLTYDFEEKELFFKIEKYSFNLNKVISNEELVPCIIMLSQGDEVRVSLY